MPNIPLNKSLYEKIKEEAKRKFKVWPSAYASGWLVKEYKKRGGKYKTQTEKVRLKSKSKSKSKSGKEKHISGLERWFKEKWIDVCYLPKIVTCGRPKLSDKNWKKNYPYCRPLYRITSSTPKTAKELDIKTLKKRCSKKRRNPLKKIRK